MKQDELFSTLRTEAANFEYLRSVFSKVYKDQVVITINTLDDPERNANLIKESLIQHLTLKKTCNQ
jgi:ribosomal protein S3